MWKRGILPVLITLLASATLLGMTQLASRTILDLKNKGQVTVKGYATKSIRSDLGLFSASFVEEDKELKVCFGRLSEQRKKIEDLLAKSGVDRERIRFSPPGILEKYKLTDKGYPTNEIESYRISQRFEVVLGDVDRIAALPGKVAELINTGTALFIEPPRYLFTGLDAVKLEMVGKATANATSRAKVISEHGQFSLGTIASVRVGIFQITPPNSMDVSDSGISDTGSIDKEIKSTVEIVYLVD